MYQSLSPDLQAEAARIVNTITHRRQHERIWDFRAFEPGDPNPHGVPCNDQKSFLMSTARERWAFGSNRSGKSEMAAYDQILFATGKHPVRSIHKKPPVNIRQVVVDLEGTAEQVWLNKMQSFCKWSDLKGGSFKAAWSPSTRTLRFKNGSKIYLKATTQQLNKFGGTDDDACYVDEHIPIAYYRECKARLIDRDGFFVCSMTPEAGGVTWEKRHIRDRQDGSVQWWQWSMYGNPKLSPQAIAEFVRSINDDRVLRVKVYGEFTALAGMVIPQFNPALSIIDDSKALELLRSPANMHGVIALDSHLKKESALLWAFWTREGNLVCYRAIKKFLTVPEIKHVVRGLSAGEKIHTWIADEAGGGEGKNIYGQESVIVQLNQGDDRLPFIGTNQSSDKSFESGIMKLREMFSVDHISQKPRIFIARNACQDLIDELDEYQFQPDTKADEMTFRERVRKINDDLTDDLRYIVMAEPNIGGVRIESAMGSV